MLTHHFRVQCEREEKPKGEIIQDSLAKVALGLRLTCVSVCVCGGALKCIKHLWNDKLE